MRVHTKVHALLLAVCTLVGAQFVPPSPCPDIFTYESDGQTTYGVIRYNPRRGMGSVTIKVNFSLKAALASNYVGQLEVIGNKQAVLQSMLSGETLTYRVHFPVTSPLPKLTSLSANGQTVCTGEPEFAGPGEAVTSIALNHMLFAEGGSNTAYEPQEPRPIKPQTTFTSNGAPAVFVDGQQVEFNTGNFEDSIEPSVSINTITLPNRQQNLSTQFVQYYPSNTINRPAVQFQPSQQRPQQQPQTQQQQRPQQQSQTQQQPRPQPQPLPPQQPQPSPPPPPPQQPQTPPRPAPVECGVVAGGNERLPLVYQGTSVARGDWPWLTALYIKRDNTISYKCAGSLITNQHVVTAAHCIHEKSSVQSYSRFIVKTGVFNLDSWSEATIRAITQAIVHPAYEPSTLENDILILTLDAEVEFTAFNRPVCLWEGATDSSFVAGQYGAVVGWGLNEIRGSGEGEPRMANIPIVTAETCRASRIEFHKLASKNTICAGDRNGTGPCNGDSGGGLYMLWGGRWRLRGVVSVALRTITGEEKCNLNEYVVFTDVAQYLSWIRQYANV